MVLKFWICNLINDRASSALYPSPSAKASASNSYFLLRMFIKSVMTVSMGASASEKRMKPIMMGNSLWKPKDWYKDRLLMKTENRAKM